MAPAIRDGDLLHVRPVVIEKLRRGDIVLFAAGRGFRAHRLVFVDRDGDDKPDNSNAPVTPSIEAGTFSSPEEMPESR